MLSLGYDIGSSSVKCTLLDCDTGKVIASGFHPKEEMAIAAPHPGWAEQDPAIWWQSVIAVTRQVLRDREPSLIKAIGISYQMHGLVLVDEDHHVLRPSIIWCDSRAVDIGRAAFDALGHETCLRHVLNSPGNFTASKLRWVKEHEPETFRRVHKAMLPGDYIGLRLTGEMCTTVPGLSEGIFWDFTRNALSSELLHYYGIEERVLPEVRPTFSVHGRLRKEVAQELGLAAGTPVAYRAGDQPNNAFSLNVLNAGEVAATAGTSGVVYGVVDSITFDPKSRVNPFAHVNHSATKPSLGVLLCINGTGILNSWLRRNVGGELSYDEMNTAAARAPVGAGGVVVVPFGNGAERILDNRTTGGQIVGLDFNRHSREHVFRAAQEGIAFSFRYGMDIMKEMGMNISVIRAGNTNMFLSPLFRETLATVSGTTIELYETDGALGAARGAAIGAGIFSSFREAFAHLEKKGEVHPNKALNEQTRKAYEAWLSHLQRVLAGSAS